MAYSRLVADLAKLTFGLGIERKRLFTSGEFTDEIILLYFLAVSCHTKFSL